MRATTRSPLVLAVVLALSLVGAGPASALADEAAALQGAGITVSPTAPVLPEIAAASWLLADLDTGEVLAAKNAHGRFAPASTLKTLTAVTLIPRLEPDLKVAPTFADVNVEGSKVGLVQRVGYPVRELFEALLMVSGNDAANALATAAGGQERTAALMNETARSLGALDTLAVNPHGLDAPGQVSSAYDLALIARAGMAQPDFARYVALRNSSVSGPGGKRIATYNHNKMLRNYPGSLGIKNGYTSTARASFVGAAQRDGRRLVVTLMKSQPRVFDEAKKLLDWGFAAGLAASPVAQLAAVPTVAADGSREPVDAAAATPAVLRTPVEAVPAATSNPPTGLPVTLGGMALAAAALLAVRRTPPRRTVPARRPAPAQRARPGSVARQRSATRSAGAGATHLRRTGSDG